LSPRARREDEMFLETIISAAYVGLSASHALGGGDPFAATMYLVVATVYLIAPHVRKDA
jgi:hypothetical protein